MPVRVKCRCGQELVLRYGEWVYLLLGIVILSLLANTACLILLYFRVDGAGAARALEAPAAAGASSPERPKTARAPSQPRGPGDAEPPAGARPSLPAAGEAGGAEPREAPQKEKPAEASAPEKAGARKAASSVDAPAPATSLRGPQHPPGAREDLEPLGDLLFPPGASKPGVDTPGAGPPPPPPKDSGEHRGDPAFAPLVEPPLLRALLLESTQGEPSILAAMLLDPDLRVRGRALDLLVSSLRRPGAATGLAPDARALIRAASPSLAGDARMSTILERLGISGATAPGAAGASRDETSSALDAVRSVARAKLSAGPAGRLRDELRAMASGVDLVIALDATQSMDRPLEAVKKEALWLFPALGWALPDLRVGLVIYRDEVSASVDLSLAPDGEPLRVLGETRAEGGGDVPEGVHLAVAAALSLGTMKWREEAQKHVVVVGDAPPPFARVAPLCALASRARREGGYRFHALSFPGDAGEKEPSFFGAFARSGGGRSSTLADAGTWGDELLLCLVPVEASAAARLAGASLRAMFSPGFAPACPPAIAPGQ